MTEAPTADTPEVVFEELRHFITDAIVNAPRSLQRRIGPSEIGEPCKRRLILKLAGTIPPEREPAWKPFVGTAIHAQLEQIMTRANDTLWSDAPRFLTEQRVSVGEIMGEEITGSTDLFDTATLTVVDWKSCGPNRMKHYRRHGASETYRAQGHLYGRGWQRAGYAVRNVMIVFLPRDGELREAFQWSEPYNEQVATAALDRANGLAHLAALYGSDGLEELLNRYAPCDDEWCRVCHERTPDRFRRPPPPSGNTTAELLGI